MQQTTYDFGPSEFSSIVQTIKAHACYFLPESILIGTVCLLFLVTLGVSRKNQKNLAWLAGLGILGALAALVPVARHESTLLFQGMVAHDGFATFFKFVFLASTLAVVVMSYLDRGLEGLPMGEYYGLVLTSVVGMFLLASATDFIMIFLALEMVSIPTYILVVFRKERRDSSEAALKYVVYGSISGAVMAYGLSLFYGLTGSTAIADLTHIAVSGADSAVLVIAGILTFAGFAYKMAAVPMHFWTPDIYQGAPTAVTAFLSVGSKAAGFAGFVRFLVAMNMGEGLVGADTVNITLDWTTILAIVSAVTMTLGNLGALYQTDVKRMFAYSSIAHAGYLLMGVAALTGIGTYAGLSPAGAVSYYFLAFTFMNLGAFTGVILVANRTGNESIDAYRGLGKRAPILAVCLTICLISLIGIPPTAGFVGKFLLIQVAIGGQLYWLAVLAGINTAISAYYYLRIVKNMFLETSDDPSPIEPEGLGRTAVLCLTAGVLLFGTFFGSAAAWVKGVDIHNPAAANSSESEVASGPAGAQE